MFDDKTPIPFGKHKGTRLENLPPAYLMTLYRTFKNDKKHAELIRYVDGKIDLLDPGKLLRPKEPLLLQEMVAPICIKKAYTTRKEAKDALKKIRADKSTHKKPIRSYECPKCSYWHLTSKPLDKFSQEAENELKIDS